MLSPRDNWIVLIQRRRQKQWGALGFKDRESAEQAYTKLANTKECAVIKLAEVVETSGGENLVIKLFKGRRLDGGTEGHVDYEMPKDCGV